MTNSCGASPRAVTSGILAEKFSWLHRSGKEYRATLDQFIDNLLKLGLECGDIPTRSQASLERALLNRREEEADIGQAGAQMERLRLLEAVEEDTR